MARLRSPRVVQVIGGVTTDTTYLGLVMEYLERGSLRHALSSGEAITPELQKCGLKTSE